MLTCYTDAVNLYKYRKHIKDKRSWQDEEGMWHVYPIAFDNLYVWIVCPICEETCSRRDVLGASGT